MHYAVFVYFGF